MTSDPLSVAQAPVRRSKPWPVIAAAAAACIGLHAAPAFAATRTYGPCGADICTIEGYAGVYTITGDTFRETTTKIVEGCIQLEIVLATAYFTAPVGVKFFSAYTNWCRQTGEKVGTNRQKQVRVDKGYQWSRDVKRGEKLKVTINNAGVLDVKTIPAVAKDRDPSKPGWRKP